VGAAKHSDRQKAEAELKALQRHAFEIIDPQISRKPPLTRETIGVRTEVEKICDGTLKMRAVLKFIFYPVERSSNVCFRGQNGRSVELCDVRF
jgi:hypothetical protein